MVQMSSDKGEMTIKTEKEKNGNLSPVVKWAGGKRQLLGDILPLIPEDVTVYTEPFVGGGAVLFALQPKKAVINDFNKELVNMYRVIKNKPHELISALEEHERHHSKEYFYTVRAMDRSADYDEMSDTV